MRKYITSEGSGENISVELGGEFGPIDMVRILNEIRDSETPQLFGIKKGGSITSNIEVRNGVAYFGCADGNFYAIDAETGKELWRFPSGDVFSAFRMGSNAIYASCFDHNVYAISFEGKLLWKFRANGKVGNEPFIWEGRIYFGSEDGNFYCVDSRGKLVWKFPANSPIAAMPVVHKGIALFGDFGGSFYALDAKTGGLAWKFRAGGGLGGCLVHKDTIYLACLNKTLYVLSLGGKEIWRYRPGNTITTSIQCKPYKDMIFFGAREGGMSAISTKERKRIWEFQTNEMVMSYSDTSEGILYFGGCDNTFYAVDAETGRLVWSFKTNGPNAGGCSVVNGGVYFGCWDCNAYCLDAKTGRLIWKFHTSMGNMSDYVVDRRADRVELSVTIRLPEDGSKAGAADVGAELSDYGEFSGAYIDKEKSDYVKSGRRGYVKKKEF